MRPMEPVRVPSIPAATFPLPPRLEGLRRLAYNLYWSWHPRTRALWSRIDRTAWTRYRNPIPVLSRAVDWDQLLADERFMADYADVIAEFDNYMDERVGPVVPAQARDPLEGADRLLLRRIRLP